MPVSLALAGLLPAVLGAGPPGEAAPRRLGTLAGQVRLAGQALPGPTPVDNTTDPESCGPRQSLEDLLVSATSRGIANVILSVDGVSADQTPALVGEAFSSRSAVPWPGRSGSLERPA